MSLRMYTDTTDTIIAESPEDAMAIWAELYGMQYTELTGCTGDDWDEVPGDKPWTLSFPDEPGRPSETRSALEWVLAEGRCHLGSTEY